MNATQNATALNALNTVEALLNKAFQILKTVIIISVAIALVLAFNAYNLGAGFRSYCDDLVSSSMATPKMLLMPSVEPAPARAVKPRKSRKPKAKPNENLTSSTYNEYWALTAKVGTIEFDDNPYGD